ncbi:MAG: hypothetical protein V4439_02520 [Patescibacteria group bacterium]
MRKNNSIPFIVLGFVMLISVFVGIYYQAKEVKIGSEMPIVFMCIIVAISYCSAFIIIYGFMSLWDKVKVSSVTKKDIVQYTEIKVLRHVGSSDGKKLLHVFSIVPEDGPNVRHTFLISFQNGDTCFLKNEKRKLEVDTTYFIDCKNRWKETQKMKEPETGGTLKEKQERLLQHLQ